LLLANSSICASGDEDIEEGFALYFKNADTEDRALDGWRALHRALTCDDRAVAPRRWHPSSLALCRL
jgi:hypothetical protein